MTLRVNKSWTFQPDELATFQPELPKAKREYQVVSHQHGKFNMEIVQPSSPLAMSASGLPFHALPAFQTIPFYLDQFALGLFAERLIFPRLELILYMATPEILAVRDLLLGAVTTAPHTVTHEQFMDTVQKIKPCSTLELFYTVCMVLGYDFAVSDDGRLFLPFLRGIPAPEQGRLIVRHAMTVHRP